jgi:predicted HTH transcriptional regulator
VPQEDLAVAYVTYWRQVTTREIAEVFNGNMERASEILEALVARGALMDISRSKTHTYAPISYSIDSHSMA